MTKTLLLSVSVQFNNNNNNNNICILNIQYLQLSLDNAYVTGYVGHVDE